MNSPSPDPPATRAMFPVTQWQVVREAADVRPAERSKALGDLAAVYWRPVYGYLRREWSLSHDDARDLTQDFFASLAERNRLTAVSQDKGKFRSYVMAALDNTARMDHREKSAAKRGGGIAPLALDAIEGFEPPAAESPEDVFQREWAGTILDDALHELEAECRTAGHEAGYRVFLARDVEAGPDDDVGYEALSRRFGLKPAEVTRALFNARKRLRELVAARIRDTVSSPEEAEAEMRELFQEAIRWRKGKT